jgi:hypothetical protein
VERHLTRDRVHRRSKNRVPSSSPYCTSGQPDRGLAFNIDAHEPRTIGRAAHIIEDDE